MDTNIIFSILIVIGFLVFALAVVTFFLVSLYNAIVLFAQFIFGG